jgi:hypothetical protein
MDKRPAQIAAAVHELGACLESLGEGLKSDTYPVSWVETVQQLAAKVREPVRGDFSQHALESQATELIELARAKELDREALAARGSACALSLAQLKRRLRWLRSELVTAKTYDLGRAGGAGGNRELLPPLLRHFFACAGLPIATQVLRFVQNKMVYRDFEPTTPAVLSVKALLIAMTKCQDATLHLVTPGFAFAAKDLVAESPLLGDRFIDTIWGLYDANVVSVVHDGESALVRGRAVQLQLSDAHERRFLAEALTSIELHTKRSATQHMRAAEPESDFVKHIGAHGNVLQLTHRAVKRLRGLLAQLEAGQPASHGSVPQVRKRLKLGGSSDDETRESDFEDVAAPAEAPGAPLQLVQQLQGVLTQDGGESRAAQTPSRSTPPAGLLQQSVQSRTSQLLGRFFRGAGSEPAATMLPDVRGTTTLGSVVNAYNADDDAELGAVAAVRVVVQILTAGELSEQLIRGEMLRVRNIGVFAVRPVFLKLEHVVSAAAVGEELKRRWDQDHFTDLRTHGFEMVDFEPIEPDQTTQVPLPDWPAGTSRRVHLELMPSRVTASGLTYTR